MKLGLRRRRLRPGIGVLIPSAIILGLILACLIPNVAAAGGGKPATKVYNVADTRGMNPGVAKWIGDVYNGNLWIFALVVVLIMSGMGLVLGFTMDLLLKLVGINLGKLQHHE